MKFAPVPLSTDPHSEEKFKFPLLQQIEDYAEEHDCSILAASKVVVPKYALELPWRDEELFYSAQEWQQQNIAENAPHSLLRQIEDKPAGRPGGKPEGGKH